MSRFVNFLMLESILKILTPLAAIQRLGHYAMRRDARNKLNFTSVRKEHHIEPRMVKRLPQYVQSFACRSSHWEWQTRQNADFFRTLFHVTVCSNPKGFIVHGRVDGWVMSHEWVMAHESWFMVVSAKCENHWHGAHGARPARPIQTCHIMFNSFKL